MGMPNKESFLEDNTLHDLHNRYWAVFATEILDPLSVGFFAPEIVCFQNLLPFLENVNFVP